MKRKTIDDWEMEIELAKIQVFGERKEKIRNHIKSFSSGIIKAEKLLETLEYDKEIVHPNYSPLHDSMMERLLSLNTVEDIEKEIEKAIDNFKKKKERKFLNLLKKIEYVNKELNETIDEASQMVKEDCLGDEYKKKFEQLLRKIKKG